MKVILLCNLFRAQSMTRRLVSVLGSKVQTWGKYATMTWKDCAGKTFVSNVCIHTCLHIWLDHNKKITAISTRNSFEVNSAVWLGTPNLDDSKMASDLQIAVYWRRISKYVRLRQDQIYLYRKSIALKTTYPCPYGPYWR